MPLAGSSFQCTEIGRARPSPWRAGSIADALELAVGRANAWNRLNLEAATLKDASKASVGSGAGGGVHDPVDNGESATPGETVAGCGEKRQHAFAATIDVSEFDDEARWVNTKLTEQMRRADAKRQRPPVEKEGVHGFIRIRQELLEGVPLD